MTSSTKAISLALAALGAAFSLAEASAPQAARSQASGNSAQFGEVRIRGYSALQTSFAVKPGSPVPIDVRGTLVQLTSARYDIAAPHIHLAVQGGAVATGVATGGVRVAVRNPEQQQTTQVTCDIAHYTRLSPGSTRARIDLEGNVHSKTFSPQFADPLINDSRTATITFGGGMPTEVSFQDGSAAVTPLEPTPAPSRRQGERG